MNFDLTDDQRALQDAARKFAREVVRPKAAHYDEVSEFPRELIAKFHTDGVRSNQGASSPDCHRS